MALPWDVEKSLAAFQRSHSMLTELSEKSRPYVEGILGTISLLPFDFEKHNLFVPNLAQVSQKLYCKTGKRLEKLMQKLVDNISAMETQLLIMNLKIEEIAQSPSFSTSGVLSQYYACQSSATAAQQLLSNLRKTAEIKYFS